MRRYEESSKDDFERAVRLGEANAKCLTHMRLWCKNVRIERTGGGLYEQMSGLPIASYKIGCPFVVGEREGMNLPWIFGDFLEEHCQGCPHHAPNGDTRWADAIISSRMQEKERREAETTARNTRIAALRADLRKQAQEIGSIAGAESKRILEFFESLFDDDATVRAENARLLKQSARLAPELFPSGALDLLVALAESDEFSASVLSICAELAARRTDLNEQLRTVAVECIELGRSTEQAAELLDRLGDAVPLPLSDSCIGKLLTSQHHWQPIGPRMDPEPDYSHSTVLLARCYDADCERVRSAIRKGLSDPNEHARVDMCGAVMLLQESRPQIFLSLAPDLLKSLEMEERERFGDAVPSSKIVYLFENAFRRFPVEVDAFVAEAMDRVRPAVQEDLVHVYRDQVLDLTARRQNDGSQRGESLTSARVALERLMVWIRDNRLEPDIRSLAAEAVEIACSEAPAELLVDFHNFLGYFAIICEQADPPPAAPRIVLPSESTNPELEHLNQFTRKQSWQTLKHRIASCLQAICDSCPSETADTVCKCFDDQTAHLGEAFKGALLGMLGRIGRSYREQPRVLPLIMRGLLDYKSAWTRAKAIDACGNMFGSARASLPANVVDTIVVHLGDPKTVVHKAALEALVEHPRWLDGRQSIEAVQRLTGHLAAYRDDPYQLATICECILRIARHRPRLRRVALHLLDPVFPTGEEYADSKIVNELLRFADLAADLIARIAQKCSVFLAKYQRGRNSFEWSERARIFRWFRRLSASAFDSVAEDLLEAGKKVATRDTWECCQFANVYEQFAKYTYEEEILDVACTALPDEQRYDKFRTTLTTLSAVAASNAMLNAGDFDGAERIFRQLESRSND